MAAILEILTESELRRQSWVPGPSHPAEPVLWVTLFIADRDCRTRRLRTARNVQRRE